MKRLQSVVLDTSAVVRLFIPDGPIPEDLIDMIALAEKGEIDILSPELLIAEFYQVILKKERKQFLSSEEVDQIYNSFNKLPIHFISHNTLMKVALEVARSYNITICDSLFLSLAKKNKSIIITADDLMKDVSEKYL